MSLREEMRQLALQAKHAARELALLAAEEKNACLLAMATAIEDQRDAIKAANLQDLGAAQNSGMAPAMLERLKLDEKRIAGMAKGLREVAALPDPVGRVLEERTRPNGLKLRKISTPLGVVVIIYESRPNVTADAASLCLKAGSATILRGGKEALHSNRVITEVMVEAGQRQLKSFPKHAIQLVQTTDREAIKELLSFPEYVDLCMPRGGENLIRAVTECSKVPVIKHYKGVCHVYIDAKADPKMAEQIALNAKVQRPSVCNAMETLLVHEAIAPVILPELGARLGEYNVELRTDAKSAEFLTTFKGKTKPAEEQDWSTEYNDYILNLKLVGSLQEAINHINQHGSAHSDSIVTSDAGNAETFLRQVDSATVYWNASTRFTDGGEFGMGAEIGISTDKIGARGPMGLNELTSYKWLGYGSGQIRT